MRLLFDITHPAHVHLFKNVIRGLQADNHDVRITSRSKDLTNELLDSYGFEYDSISAKGDHKLSLLTEWSQREIRLFRIARQFDPDAIVSRLNPPAAHVAKLLGCPSIIFDDSERAHLAAKLTHPFATIVCTPQSYKRDIGPKQRRYNGFHELAYLHPEEFSPDPEVLMEHEIESTEQYYVLRFVSWGAHHDVGKKGLSLEAKRRLVERLSESGTVYISSEGELPGELKPYELQIPPHLVHHVLYFADLYVGDSQTMAAEAGLLGTPAIRANSFAKDNDMGNFEVLENKYELVYSLGEERKVFEYVDELTAEETKEIWAEKRSALYDEMINVTEYIRKTIEEAVDETN